MKTVYFSAFGGVDFYSSSGYDLGWYSHLVPLSRLLEGETESQRITRALSPWSCSLFLHKPLSAPSSMRIAWIYAWKSSEKVYLKNSARPVEDRTIRVQ